MLTLGLCVGFAVSIGIICYIKAKIRMEQQRFTYEEIPHDVTVNSTNSNMQRVDTRPNLNSVLSPLSTSV